MNITLIGYGKIGKEIEKIALAHGHTIIATLDSEEDWKNKWGTFLKSDVAIEFTMPSAVIANLKKCFANGIPVVTGTTGWHDQLDQVLADCRNHKATLFYASNFSIGMNLFFEISRRLAKLMDQQPMYEVALSETHHIHKLDKPSGTAITLVKDLIQELGRKETWTLDQAGSENEISVRSYREGEVTGIHEVIWESDADRITLKHEAKNRRGFAYGAVLAAEFLLGKNGVYTMKDLLSI